MTSTILGITSGNKAVVNILKAILAKPVQQMYSGSGRKIKGIGKQNFSKTNTYLYMRGTFFYIKIQICVNYENIDQTTDILFDSV